jgi:trk system potassium uptake protein
MYRQAMVIGLGQFGMSVARALAQKRVEVYAVDVDAERVRAASTFAAHAACFDASDESALAKTAPERRDVCLCAIGDEARDAAIICTALLTQMGARRVIARANDDLLARILTLVGAHQVVNPEREFGERFSNSILHQSIKGEMPLGASVLISEAEAPAAFVGHSLTELQLPKRYGVTLVALRKALDGSVVLPDAKMTIEQGDVLVVVGRTGALNRMLDRS